MKSLRFEKLEAAHIPYILEIERQVNTAPWSEKSFQNELNHPHGRFMVAIGDGKVVGYGGFWMVIDEAHITTVAVAPEYQRQGVGRRLMLQLLEMAKEAEMACSTLEVRAGNAPAIQLYEKLGYQTTARRRNYYPDTHEDAIVMWLHDLQNWQAPSK